MDVLGWLRNLGLEQYEAIFRDNDIDASLLSSLTNEDLKEIGVASLGHRRKLLEAIAVLRTEQAEAAVGPTLVIRRKAACQFFSPGAGRNTCRRPLLNLGAIRNGASEAVHQEQSAGRRDARIHYSPAVARQ